MKFEKVYNVRPVQFKGMNDQLIRSGRLMFSTENDIKVLKNEIKTVVDFRGAHERKEFPNPEGLNTVCLDPMADAAALASGAKNIDMLDRDLSGVMKNQYYDFVHNSAAQKAYREFLLLLTDQNNFPVLFHCTAGKDRTGYATALVLSLMGADRDFIMKDYLRTNDEESDPQLMKEFNAMSDQTKKDVYPLITAIEEYMTISLDEIEKMGGICTYCTNVLGLSESQIGQIQKNLTL
ncbi:MAG: tyrosine-protein phosphatase [Erysipelotrichaceae bacterium]|nr:tyrosine-protein phosphatase [Erysipelotrichaceae bacterium]